MPATATCRPADLVLRARGRSARSGALRHRGRRAAVPGLADAGAARPIRRVGRASPGSRSARRTSCTSAAPSRARSLGARTLSARRTGRHSPTPAGRRARTSATPSARLAARSGLGRPDGHEPRPDPVPGRRADGGPAGPVRRRGRAGRGARPDRARTAVDRAIDRWVWYAGWADKIAQVLGSSNPVARRYFNFTIPEPTGVVGLVAPESSSLLGLVSRLAPPLVAGNAVRRAHVRGAAAAGDHAHRGPRHVGRPGRRRQHPDRATQGARARAGGARRRRRDRRLGRPGGPAERVEVAAAENVKRVVRRPAGVTDARFDWLDDRAAERPEWIAAFLEMKTVWHPIGV